MSPPTSVEVPIEGGSLVGRRLRGLRGVRLLDGTLADVDIAGAGIEDVRPAAALAGDPAGHAPGGRVMAAASPDVVVAANGWRLLPAATEPHAHLDKALTGPRVDPGAGNDLVAAIEQWRSIVPNINAADVVSRSWAALARYVASGTTTIRTHVDLLLQGDPFRSLDAIAAVREHLGGVAHLEICLLAGSQSPTSVIHEALAHGVDVLGGCPHLAPDPSDETTRLLDVAQEHGLPVDLHTDEHTNSGPADLVELAEQVLARGFAAPVTASHCVALGMLAPDDLARVLDLVKRAGISLVTLPITNLYLQGRTPSMDPSSPGVVPRGMPPLRAILDAGILLAAGADNLRDPFNPVGTADPFETTALLVAAGHLRPGEALAAVTTAGREVLNLPAVGARNGCAADLMLVPDVPVEDVVAGSRMSRVVVHGGLVVADTRVSTRLAAPFEAEQPLATQTLATAN